MNASLMFPGDFRWRATSFESLEALLVWSRANPTCWVSLDSDPDFYYVDALRHRMADGVLA